jgi:hypothetical protein
VTVRPSIHTRLSVLMGAERETGVSAPRTADSWRVSCKDRYRLAAREEVYWKMW